MAEQDEDARELNEAEKVLGFALVAGSHSTKRLEPRDGSLHSPPLLVASQRASVLRFMLAIPAIRRDHLDAHGQELGVEHVAVICLILVKARGKVKSERRFRRGVNDCGLKLSDETVRGWYGKSGRNCAENSASADLGNVKVHATLHQLVGCSAAGSRLIVRRWAAPDHG